MDLFWKAGEWLYAGGTWTNRMTDAVVVPSKRQTSLVCEMQAKCWGPKKPSKHIKLVWTSFVLNTFLWGTFFVFVELKADDDGGSQRLAQGCVSLSVRRGVMNQIQQSCWVKAHSEQLCIPSPRCRRLKMQIKNTMAPNSRGGHLRCFGMKANLKWRRGRTNGFSERSVKLSLQPLLSFGSVSFLRALLLVQIVRECSSNRHWRNNPRQKVRAGVSINKLNLIVLPSLTKVSTGEGVAGKNVTQKSQAVYSFC